MFDVQVSNAQNALAAGDSQWDALALSAGPAAPFITSGWLSAWFKTYGRNQTGHIVRVNSGNRLIAAAAFSKYGNTLRFAGQGPSDYTDVLLSQDLDDSAATSAARSILEACATLDSGHRTLRLVRFHPESRTLDLLHRYEHGLRVIDRVDVQAPALDLSEVDSRLRKRSVRRHFNTLRRQGDLVCYTYRDEKDVLEQLGNLFDLHVARWQRTNTPSLFSDPVSRDFYRRITPVLASLEMLRFTTLKLDDHIVACHFGMASGDRFYWYKPAFDPEYARFSPGEVLLKFLLEQARDEHLRVFDFTIGAEPFKLRFASEIHRTHRVLLTRSKPRYLFEWAKARVMSGVDRITGA
jgi:CelD/BcsL family acetyltransferase involved in cellulose biosynthesis|tara:strand:+ start:1395 stop:2450 length:1056 start_codon:yes stop_codon:yes gene_type:complete